MILLSHTGRHRNGRHVAQALERAGLLGEFWTCSGDSAGWPLRVAPEPSAGAAAAAGARLAERAIPGGCLLERSPPGPPNGGADTRALDQARLSQSLDLQISRRLESSRFTAVYAYQDGADESFRVAGRRGVLQLYDLPLGHHGAARAMFEEEAALEPEWALTWSGLPPANTIARQDSELAQAGLAFVASSFGLRTLERAPVLPGAVAIIPYGAPALSAAAPPVVADRPSSARLRVLFIGELGQHHGLSYLLRAFRELRGAISLTMIGARPHLPCAALERELRDIRWFPPCPSDQVLAEMAAHDVLVHPSLFDPSSFGFLEAMAMGLPVIATPNTAAADLIDDGIEGFIVPARSSASLVEKLDLLRLDPARRNAMAVNARRRAGRHSWADYERTLAASVATALARR